MNGYRGEKVLKRLKGTQYEGYTRERWALEFIGQYGQIDGDHHKAWVLDQVARVIFGTPVVVKLASWIRDGEISTEFRFETGKPTKTYLNWVEDMKHDSDGEEYGYEEGISP